MPLPGFVAFVNHAFEEHDLTSTAYDSYFNRISMHDLSANTPSFYRLRPVGAQFQNMALVKRANFMALRRQSCHCTTAVAAPSVPSPTNKLLNHYHHCAPLPD